MLAITTSQTKAIKIAKHLMRLNLKAFKLPNHTIIKKISFDCKCGESIGIRIENGCNSVVVGVCKQCSNI